jgi:hypothetical protein
MGDLMEMKSLQDPIRISYVSLDKLHLDDNNPRFAGLIKSAKEDEIFKALQQEMHLDELVESFKQNGYYNVEPLLVIRRTKTADDFTVVEGNRRLAALKLLHKEKTKLSSSLQKNLFKDIPIAIYPDRKILWTYLGFRHINGPKEWDSYSKAVYAYTVHKNWGVSINDISMKIGDKHQTVVKMVNGLTVLDQADKRKVFTVGDVQLRKFYFSHLYTILQYDNTITFLGIKSAKGKLFTENPVSKVNLGNLKILLEFLFGNPDKDIKPVIKSQNPDLRLLDTVLGNSKAFKYLKENSQESQALANAISYTDKEDIALDEFVYKSLNNLRKASGLLHRYKGEDALYEEMQEIKDIVEDILLRMTKVRKAK